METYAGSVFRGTNRMQVCLRKDAKACFIAVRCADAAEQLVVKTFWQKNRNCCKTYCMLCR